MKPRPVLDPDRYAADLASEAASDRAWLAPWHEIEALRLMPGCTLADDLIIVPEEWARTKRQLVRSARTVDFCKVLPPEISRASSDAEGIIRRAKRLALLLFITPIRYPSGYVRQPGKPTTWVKECEGIVSAIAWILKYTEPSSALSTCPDRGTIFKRLTKECFERMRNSTGLSSFWKHGAPKLAALALMGLIDDWPDFDLGTRREPRRKHADTPATADTKKKRWQPFSDEFTSKIGKAALWMSEVLGPVLLSCLEHSLTTGRSLSPEKFRSEQPRIIQEWYQGTETPLHGKTFPIKVQVAGVEMDTLPPRNWVELRMALSRLQTAHMIVIALATALRESELIALERDCLQSVGTQDLLIGHTFKLSDAAGGERRNWPLPTCAVTVIRNQQKLADLLSPGGEQLWLSFDRGFDRKGFTHLRKFYDSLSKYCRCVTVDGRTLTAWCSDGHPHPHRFRKTVARLAALSMVGATSIMFDILGHRDPKMTLNYILSDPDLQDEIRKIATETNVAISKSVVESAPDNGGPAGPAVLDLVQRVAARSAENEIGVSSMNEAAEILSMNGQVTMIKPGVLCTKTARQRGPCTKRAGVPDIGNCSAECSHRLEHAAASSDCVKAIERILTEMPPPEQTMMRGWWQSQLVNQLRKFPAVRLRYLSDGRVRAALSGVGTAALDSMTSTAEERNGEVAA